MKTHIYEIAALSAALSWAVGTIISAIPAKHLGTIAFNRLRLTVDVFLLATIVSIFGAWSDFPAESLPIIILSGFIGIFIGDTALFACFNRLGARRTSILFAMNAPISVLLGWLFLGEALKAQELLGIGIAIFGVVLAIIFGKRKSQISHWEHITPPLWLGVVLGLIAATGQSLGSILISPIMETGANPFVISLFRVATGAMCLHLLTQLLPSYGKRTNPLTKRVFALTTLSGFIGMVVGMTLILFALTGGEVGIVATLSATTPVLVLPLLWLTTKERPALGAWAGAALVTIGTGFIFTA